MKAFTPQATEGEVAVQLHTFMTGAQEAFRNRLQFAGTGVDQIHTAFNEALTHTKSSMILDQANLEGLIPAIPTGQKKQFLADRNQAIEATCDFLVQVNDAVKAELGINDATTTDEYSEAFFRIVETTANDGGHQLHGTMTQTIRHLAGSDVDTIAASIAETASPATEKNDRAKLNGFKKLALFAPLALLITEMTLSTYAIGKYANKGVKAHANQPDIHTWENSLAKSIDQTGGFGETGVFVAVALAVLGVNKMVQAAGNEAVTRRKVRKLTESITTPDLVEKNRLLARISELGGGVSGKRMSWAKTIIYGTLAVGLSFLAVKEPHTKGKIAATVAQLEADQKAGDFVSQVATVLGQIEDAMKKNDATAQLVDSQSKAYLEAEGRSGKGAAFEAKKTALEGGSYTPPANGKPALVQESQTRLSQFAGGPDKNPATGLSAEYAGIVLNLKHPAETMNQGVLNRLTELQSKIDNHTVELDDIKAVANYIKDELEKLKTNLATATEGAKSTTKAYEDLLRDLNDISNRAYPGRPPLSFSVNVAIADIDVDKLVADVMASVPKVEYLTAAELVAKLEELTKDQPGYAAKVKRMGEIYGWSVEFGMRFTCFLAAALIIGFLLTSRNTGLKDYKSALDQSDKLVDLFSGFINNPDVRQFLKIPEGDVDPDMIRLAIKNNMQREIAKREKEEDTRVKLLGPVHRIVRAGSKFKGWVTNIRATTDVGLETLREGFAAIQGGDGKLRGEFISGVLGDLFGEVKGSINLAALAKTLADAQVAMKKNATKGVKDGEILLTKEDKRNIALSYIAFSAALNEMEASFSTGQLDFQSIPGISSLEAARIEKEIRDFIKAQRDAIDHATNLLSPADSRNSVGHITALRSRIDGCKAQITTDVSRAANFSINENGQITFS